MVLSLFDLNQDDTRSRFRLYVFKLLDKVINVVSVCVTLATDRIGSYLVRHLHVLDDRLVRQVKVQEGRKKLVFFSQNV